MGRLSLARQAASRIKERHRIEKEAKRETRAFSDPTGSFVATDLSFLGDLDKSKILSDAGRLASGEYQIFSYEPYGPIRWCVDPVSGKELKGKATSSLIRVSRLWDDVDVKNYWDQGHLHGALTLAEAYRLTGYEAYAESAAALILDWDRHNPLDRTICWKCPMDSAIRLANIVNSLGLIEGSQASSRSAETFGRLVLEHVLMISAFYEDKGRHRNNHLLADYVGVAWGCAYLVRRHGCARAGGILSEAVELLAAELDGQINDDGSDYENSTYYHCFVTELVAETVSMLGLNSARVPSPLAKMAAKMLGCCDYYGAFDSSIPLIGDQDGSRLFLLKGFFDVDRCDFSPLARFPRERGSGRMAGVHRFDEGGFRLFVKCGGVGTAGAGVHDHNDQLSICIFYNGVPLIVDGGTFLYTSDLASRRLYRSEEKHSTVCIEGASQNEIGDNPFAMETSSEGRVEEVSSCAFVGSFDYGDVAHRRAISLRGNSIVVEDRLLSESIPKATAFSRLLLGVENDGAVEVSEGTAKVSLSGQSLYISSSSPLAVERGRRSAAYGRETGCVVLKAPLVDDRCLMEIRGATC